VNCDLNCEYKNISISASCRSICDRGILQLHNSAAAEFCSFINVKNTRPRIRAAHPAEVSATADFCSFINLRIPRPRNFAASYIWDLAAAEVQKTAESHSFAHFKIRRSRRFRGRGISQRHIRRSRTFRGRGRRRPRKLRGRGRRPARPASTRSSNIDSDST